jgi:hypothetical protein
MWGGVGLVLTPCRSPGLLGTSAILRLSPPLCSDCRRVSCSPTFAVGLTTSPDSSLSERQALILDSSACNEGKMCYNCNLVALARISAFGLVLEPHCSNAGSTIPLPRTNGAASVPGSELKRSYLINWLYEQRKNFLLNLSTNIIGCSRPFRPWASACRLLLY